MELEELRKEINTVDNDIVTLFKKRMQIASAVADYKREHNMPVLDKGRERELLSRIAELAGDDMQMYARLLYATILTLSRSYQHRCLSSDSDLCNRVSDAIANTDKLFPEHAVVACQGVEGAYSSLACERVFKNPEILFFERFENIFAAVQKGICQYGILPIENSTAGSVNRVYDLMSQNKFSIVRSIRLKINHALLAKPNTKVEEIHEIFSHEQAILQCSTFLESLPNVKVTVCENTAAAAKAVAVSNRTDVAAIASPECIKLYTLVALKNDIQNNENNYTRFICISKDLEIYPGANKTSMMMTLPHEPGALYNVLSRFYAHDMNLLKLESRPLPDGDFDFRFYFDVEVSVYSKEFLTLLGELESESQNFAYLGSYSELL